MRCYFLRLIKYTLTFLLLTFTVAGAQAAQPAVHISAKPGWLSVYKPYNQKPSLRTIEGGSYYALVEHQVHVEKQADYRHYIREIVSETGIQNSSQISVTFDPLYERLDFHEITVWRNNKPQNRLKASAFKVIADEKELSNFIYQGTYSALCILDDIRKGDRIEYSYTITGRNPIFNNKFSTFLYLQYYQTIAHQYTSVVFPSAHNINMRLFNDAPKPVITDAGGVKRYDWEAFQVKPAIYDDNAPAWFDARQYVQLSDYNNWAEVVNWALSINPPDMSLTGELAAEVSKLKAAAGSNKEKYFRSAVRLVQDEVRYMGIELGAYSHRANRPAKVFTQRYGDCKDKSLLLVSILRANGIDANMVLINSNSEDLDKYMPAHNLFDHATVVATMNGKKVWVDATISSQGGTGADIYYPDYNKGLILSPGNTALTPIPAPKLGKVMTVDSFVVKKVKSPVQLIVKTTYTLNQADKERDALASSGMAETEKNYLKYYSDIYNKIESKDSIEVIDNLNKNILVTIEKYEITDFFKRDSVSGSYEASFDADFIRSELPKITNQTKTPVFINKTTNQDYTVKMYLPDGWNVKSEQDSIIRDAYRFTSDYSSDGKLLTLNYKFQYLKWLVPVNKLDEFKQDIKLLRDKKLSYGITVNPDLENAQTSNINQWMLNLALFIILIAGFAAYRIYCTETPGIVFSHGATFEPLGGWLILLLIGLFLTPVIVIINLVDTNYFTIAVWHNVGKYSYASSLKAHIIFKVCGLVITGCYAIFCLVLFLTRRDITPKYMIGYLAFNVVFRVADYIIISSVSRMPVSQDFVQDIVSTAIAAAIWVPYFIKSVRVQQTFIVPYPRYNYSYEKRETDKAG
jgi:transglutaminase-like putative cysteine protease